MKIGPKLAALLFLVILLPLVFAEISSTSYKITSYVVDSGGSNITSSNYKTDFTIGEIARNITSALYKLFLGFWCTVGDTTPPTITIIAPASVATTNNVGGLCEAKWNCSEWRECSSEGKQTRKCEHIGTCFMLHNKPEEERNCTYAQTKVEINETCFDGIKNQNEEGIDCGGVCKPCAEVPAPEKEERRLLLLWIIVFAIILLTYLNIKKIRKISKKKIQKKKKA